MTQREDKKEERRESIRVRVHFPLPYSLIEEEEFFSIKDTYCQHRTSDRDGLPAPFQSSVEQSSMERNMEENLGHGFVQMWKIMNQKIDMICSALAAKKVEGWEKEALCVELGGMSLKLREKAASLTPGRRLKLRISPPIFPPFSIAVLGSVERVEEKNDETGRPFFESVVVFDVINKDDQESIYAYLFKRQREIIRSAAS